MDSTSFHNFILDEVEEIKRYLHENGRDYSDNQSIIDWIDSSSEIFRQRWLNNR